MLDGIVALIGPRDAVVGTLEEIEALLRRTELSAARRLAADASQSQETRYRAALASRPTLRIVN